MKRPFALFAFVALGLLLVGGGIVGLGRFLAEDEYALAREEATEFEQASETPTSLEARRFDPGPQDEVVDASSPRAFPDEILDGPRRLLRLLGPDGEPVSGAAVHFVGQARVEAFTARESMSISPGLARLAPRIGLSDERGELAFRASRGEGLVVALQGELFGTKSFGRDGESFDLDSLESIFSGSRSPTYRIDSGITTIRLAAYDLVEVRVQDEDGAALPGMPLRLVAGRGPSSRAWIALGHKGRWSEIVPSSHPEGRARFLVPRAMDGGSELVLDLAGFFAGRVTSPVAERHRSGEPLKLTAPLHGSLEVVLVDGEGRRIGASGELRVGVSNRPASTQTFELRDGRRLVMPVGLDVPLDLRFEPEDQALSRPLSDRANGPTRAGEVVRVELELAAHGLSVQALCLGPDGRPLADQEVQGHFGREFIVSRTDAEGRLVFGLDQNRLRVVGSNEMVLRWMNAGGLGGEIRDRVDLPVAGRVDLGEIRFERPPLLVAGRVVDDLGRPIDGLAPRATLFDLNDSGGFANHLDAANMTVSITDHEGRFELRGLGEGDDVQVTVEAPGHLTQRIVVPRGTTDLLITAPRLARLRGRLLRPQGLEAREIELWVANDEGKRRRVGATAKDGRFEFLLEAGRHAALRAALPQSVAGDMRLDAMRSETLREDLFLPPGETMNIGDHRITFPARFVEVKILDARLLPPRDARLVLEDVETGIVFNRIRLKGRARSVEIAVPRLPVDVAIDAAGIRFERTRIATTEVVLVVRPATRIRVEVLDFDGLRHDHDATLVLTDEDGMGEIETTIKLDREGRGEVLVPTHGPHALVLRVHKMFGTWNDEFVQIVPESPDSIQVLDGGGEQRLRIGLPEGALGNASRSLREN